MHLVAVVVLVLRQPVGLVELFGPWWLVSESVCLVKAGGVVFIEVRDGDRDDAHLDPLKKCEILSTIMAMVGGTAAMGIAR